MDIETTFFRPILVHLQNGGAEATFFRPIPVQSELGFDFFPPDTRSLTRRTATASFPGQLYGTDIRIGYSESMDEFSVACSEKNMKITEEFCVRGYYRSYDGIALLKHALHNTCPDMMKCIGKDDNGNDIKVRDAEGILLANSKIDEIRNNFSNWLEEQSQDFKERLTEMYNRKFNCYVRPTYDGSHQTFPDLDMKSLERRYGIKSIYGKRIVSGC